MNSTLRTFFVKLEFFNLRRVSFNCRRPLRVFFGLTLKACIYISHAMAITGAKARLEVYEQKQTKLSKNSKIFLGKVRKIFSDRNRFYKYCSQSAAY